MQGDVTGQEDSVPGDLTQDPAEHHFRICALAEEHLRRLADGNGLVPDQVRLGPHETAVYSLRGDIRITLTSSSQDTSVPGHQVQGTALTSKSELKDAIGVAKNDIHEDENIKKALLHTVQGAPGKGWDLAPTSVPLRAAHKTFSYVETCQKCHGKGRIQCPKCFGTGESMCMKCRGTGLDPTPDNPQNPCSKCDGTGRVWCKTCKGDGLIECKSCNATGKKTKIHQIQYSAALQFAPLTEDMNDEISEVIDKLNSAHLVDDGHVDIHHGEVQKTEDNSLSLPVMVHLPVATATFQIEGTPQPVTIAGLTGQIVEIDPFLDPRVKSGINALIKMSKGPMATGALVQKACSVRVLREIMMALDKKQPKNVYKQIKKEYGLVLSDKYMNAAIKHADIALRALGSGPRLRGLMIGSVSALAIYALYFLTLRKRLFVMNAEMLDYFDIGVWFGGFAITYVLIRILATQTLQKALPGQIAPDIKHMAAAKEYGAYGLIATLTVWVSFMFFATPKTGLIAQLFKLLNLL